MRQAKKKNGDRSAVARQKPSFDEQRVNVVELLRDRGNDLVSGPTLKDFAEMGAHQGGRMVLTSEFIRRYFGVPPKNSEDPEPEITEEYVGHLRGASHVLLEVRLLELKRDVTKRGARGLWQKVEAVFPRDEGGHRDYERLAKKAREYEKLAEEAERDRKAVPAPKVEEIESDPEKRAVHFREAVGECKAAVEDLKGRAAEYAARAAEIRKDLWLCDRGVDLLTLLCTDDDLFVEFARAQTLRDEEKMEKRNAEILADYEEARSRMKEKDAAFKTAVAHGISTTRVRQIAELRRMEAGEPKRGRGRPPKAG